MQVLVTRHHKSCLDLSNFVHGKDWVQCYTSSQKQFPGWIQMQVHNMGYSSDPSFQKTKAVMNYD
ncbi:hypothetical protein BT96DRAFT_860450 [Gymnopus androsaceus JB14]|uniref:Uncharacterized protein n=1 Tax=Gymnopus androsaceus JB14 TaxID=1447944 RepID=A0A6A4HHA3_9AGAR|nr:hypothetical protein BT96DRAFT_860450 [Gymnopus androsaceus JB14]